MSHFDENELAKLFHLCRIDCRDEEKKHFLNNLKTILDYVGQLNEVNTDAVPATTHLAEASHSVVRSDVIDRPLSREDFLANAPSHVGGMIRVPPVIKF